MRAACIHSSRPTYYTKSCSIDGPAVRKSDRTPSSNKRAHAQRQCPVYTGCGPGQVVCVSPLARPNKKLGLNSACRTCCILCVTCKVQTESERVVRAQYVAINSTDTLINNLKSLMVDTAQTSDLI